MNQCPCCSRAFGTFTALLDHLDEAHAHWQTGLNIARRQRAERAAAR